MMRIASLIMKNLSVSYSINFSFKCLGVLEDHEVTILLKGEDEENLLKEEDEEIFV